MNIFKSIITNKIIQYVMSRYFTYFLQFINSMFIAVYLGPYYLGIWGFITLIIQYLNQINFGIAHSVNAIISINKNKEWYVQKVIGTSLTMLIGLSLIVLLVFGLNVLLDLNLGEKYNFSSYAVLVLLIGILGYFNSLLSNVFRVYGKIMEIAFNQSVFSVLVLSFIFFFKGEKLLEALVWANLVAFFLSLILFVYRSPVKLEFLYIGKLVKTIQIKGWYLFLYNSSFYLIIISTRTFVSTYYSVKEFGYFTFGFTLANIILLLLQSFSFLITPKLFNRFASASKEQSISILNMVRDVYITTSHFLVHLAILLFPLFLFFFKQYTQSEVAFKLIALTIVLYSNSFGYSGLLISKSREKRLGYISIIALIINIILAYVLIKLIYVSFSLVIIATMVSYFIFVLFLSAVGRKQLGLKFNLFTLVMDVFPIKLFIPYLFSLLLIVFSVPNISFIIPFSLFLILNYKTFNKTIPLIRNIIVDSKIIDI